MDLASSKLLMECMEPFTFGMCINHWPPFLHGIYYNCAYSTTLLAVSKELQ